MILLKKIRGYIIGVRPVTFDHEEHKCDSWGAPEG